MLNGHSMKPFSLLVLLMALSCQVIGLAEVVDIPDPNLKAALVKALGKNEGDVITKEDLAGLKELKRELNTLKRQRTVLNK